MPQTHLNPKYLATSDYGIDPSSGIVPVDLEAVLRKAAQFFDLSEQEIREHRSITIQYFDEKNAREFADAFRVRQNEPAADNIVDTPAFADFDGKIRIQLQTLTTLKNGNFDQVEYQSTFIHEVMHALSLQRRGLQDYSKTTQHPFDWDEAATDYFAEQVAKSLYGEEFHYHSGYYTDGHAFTRSLREQFSLAMGTTGIAQIKQFYIHGVPSEADFSAWLDTFDTDAAATPERRTPQQRLDDRVAADSAALAKLYSMYRTQEGNLGLLTAGVKLTKINRVLSSFGVAVLSASAPRANICFYGRSQWNDFQARYLQAFSGAQSGGASEIPDVFRMGNVILVYIDSEAVASPPRAVIDAITTAGVEYLVEQQLKGPASQQWLHQDSPRLRQLSELIAAEIAPALGTAFLPVQAIQPAAVVAERDALKAYFSAQGVAMTAEDRDKLKTLLSASDAPAGWSSEGALEGSPGSGSWRTLPVQHLSDVALAATLDSSFNYQRQLIVQLQSDDTSYAAAQNLFEKHPRQSEWAQWGDGGLATSLGWDAAAQRMHSGTPLQLGADGKVRIVLVGHGTEQGSRFGGMDALAIEAGLAQLLAQDTQHRIKGIVLDLVGCQLADSHAELLDTLPGKLANWLMTQADTLGIDKTAISVSAREYPVRVTADGKKEILVDGVWRNKEATRMLDELHKVNLRWDPASASLVNAPPLPPGAVSQAQAEASVLNRYRTVFGINADDSNSTAVMKQYAEQLSGVSSADIAALRMRFPGISDAVLLEKAAVESARLTLSGNAEASEALKVGHWVASDAEHYLVTQGVLLLGGTRDVINGAALEALLQRGSALDQIRLTGALQLLDTRIGQAATTALAASTDERVRNFGSAYADPQSRMADISGDGFSVFTSLISIRNIIAGWNNASSVQKGLDFTDLAGGVLTTSLITNAIGKAFSAAGLTLGTIGNAVKASVLGVAMAPITFAALGLQWQDFWKGNADVSSLEYRSLVASTVVTTLTTALGIALTGVSIAASLGAVAATSAFAAIAASAGPIGVAIGVAAFLVNGVVQGAMQVAKYSSYFDNAGDAAAQFFAAWIGVQTDGLGRAIAYQQGQEDADAHVTTLTAQWESTKQYLSNAFAKDGFQTVGVRGRSYQVTPGVVSQNGRSDFSYLLQQNETYDGDLSAARGDLAHPGDSVWTALGQRADAVALGTDGHRNLFNLDDYTIIGALVGMSSDDVFQLTRGSHIGGATGVPGLTGTIGIVGGAGNDTLVWNARGGSLRDPSAAVEVSINTSEQTAVSRVGSGVLENFNVRGVENFSVTAGKRIEIRADDADNHVFEANSENSDVYGGSGQNTFVLTNHTHAHSQSNDVFLWSAGATASIQLTPNQERVALFGNQAMAASSASQQALIELPYSYSDVRLFGDGVFALKLIGPDHATLTIDNVFDVDGHVQRQKGLLFRDKNGIEFSLNMGARADFVDEADLARVSKSFVFRWQQGHTYDAAHALHIYGDRAANSYHFGAGSGYFVIEPDTTMVMNLVLGTEVSDIAYAYQGTKLVLSYTSNGKTLNVSIPDYATHRAQLNFYGGDGTAVQTGALFPLDLPLSGSGQLSATTLRLPDSPTHVPAPAPSEEAATGLLALSGVALHHWVSTVADVAQLSVSIDHYSKLQFLRVGMDLVLYDQDKLNPQYGLQSTTQLRVKDYFRSGEPAGMTIDGVEMTGAMIAAKTTQYLDAPGAHLLDLDGAWSEASGGEGADIYRIDMASRKSYTIYNLARDGVPDQLQLRNVAIDALHVTRQGEDLVLDNGDTVVVLKDYLLDADHRHLTFYLNDGSGSRYALPSLGANGVDLYQTDGSSYQTVKLFNQNHTNVVDILPDGGPGSVRIVLPADLSSYTKSALGLDLKLVSDTSTIYLRNYYAYPQATSFSWSGASDDATVTATVLPDTWSQDYPTLAASRVPAEWQVRYAQAGLVSNDGILAALAYQQGNFLQPVAAADYATVFQNVGELSALITVVRPARGMQKTRIFSNREDSASPGFEFLVDSDGALWMSAASSSFTAPPVKLFDAAVAPSGSTLLIYYEQSSRTLLVWNDAQNSPLRQNDMTTAQRDTLASAWRQPGAPVSHADAETLYTGNPARITTQIRDLISDLSNGTTLVTHAQARSLYRLEGIVGLSDEVIDQLVDTQSLVSLAQIHSAVDYLNKGVRNAGLIKRLINDGQSPAATLNIRLVAQLEAAQASDLFIFKALKAHLSAVEASLYLQYQVSGNDIATIQRLLGANGPVSAATPSASSPPAASPSLSLVKQALRIAGYTEAMAELLKDAVALVGMGGAAQVARFVDAGYTEAAAIAGYVNESVTVEDLARHNAIRTQYENGDRRSRITVSVSDNLSEHTPIVRYYLNQDYTDNGGRTLHAGQLLDTAALDHIPGRDSGAYSALDITRVSDGIAVGWKGNSSLSNLVDGNTNDSESYAWSWVSPLDAQSAAQSRVLAEDGWLQLDLQDRVAATGIRLRVAGGQVGLFKVKFQAFEAGKWQDVTSAFNWQLNGAAQDDIQFDFTKNLPQACASYRVVLKAGALPINVWLTEIELITADRDIPAVPRATLAASADQLVQSMAALSSAPGLAPERAPVQLAPLRVELAHPLAA